MRGGGRGGDRFAVDWQNPHRGRGRDLWPFASRSAAPFAVGDLVRVRQTVASPVHGWGSVSHLSVGVVTRISGTDVRVDFAEQEGKEQRQCGCHLRLPTGVACAGAVGLRPQQHT